MGPPLTIGSFGSLPQPSVPRFDLMPSLFVDSLILSIVCFAVSLSLAKIFAKKYAYTVRPNQELLALGTANVFSSFFLCYPSSAALSRSTLQARVGGKTQLAGLVSCVLVLTVLLFLAPFLYHLPKVKRLCFLLSNIWLTLSICIIETTQCTLSCIILVALKGMFMQIGEFSTFWRISKLDGVSWLSVCKLPRKRQKMCAYFINFLDVFSFSLLGWSHSPRCYCWTSILVLLSACRCLSSL